MQKMYILVKEDISLGFALVAVAHASLAAYLKFQGTTNVEEWISGPFYKTICKVSTQEFEKAKEFPDSVVITESALDGQEVAIAFKPREEWPKAFKFYRLYR
jgi:peptidyl-tRNA hydrolase